MLFVHGLGGAAEAWRPQLDALSPMVRCVAWTMPGYGRSRPLQETSIATLAQAALDLLDSLGVGQAVVVGQSMGGFIAQELALSHPNRVERLVLLATTAVFGGGVEAVSSDYKKGFIESRVGPLEDGRRMADLAPGAVRSLVAPDCPPAVTAAAAKMMAAIGPKAYRQAVEALVDWDGRNRLGSLGMPTLCLAGAADTAASPEAMTRLADLIPQATLEVIEGAGHLLNVEQPATVNQRLRSFLAWM